MRILDLEISRHDWRAMTCGCGRSAAHVPEGFLSALHGPLPSRVGEDWADNHVYIQSNLMEPAYATAQMLVAALADRQVPLTWRSHVLAVLSYLVCGEQDDVAARCREAVRGCTELLFEEVVSGRCKMAAAYAFEVLTGFTDLRERLRTFQSAAASNLPPDLQPARLDLDTPQRLTTALRAITLAGHDRAVPRPGFVSESCRHDGRQVTNRPLGKGRWGRWRFAGAQGVPASGAGPGRIERGRRCRWITGRTLRPVGPDVS
ncbi:hypothetical protein [Streptomyces tibetensis]|uniref:hypothetical protein n=1 Tax=Streptomyces tibetensis TaxID=2382123 RepID=UPI0033E83C2D